MAIGDCECGHSLIYHMPFVGCVKCDCDEFHRWVATMFDGLRSRWTSNLRGGR